MPNIYFQFKQFRVLQDRCAMKVSTDACILGAYTAQNYAQNRHSILDIGAGTGLLSLMLAQATQAQITAVEIEENAYQQAKANFEASRWADRLHIFHQAIQEVIPVQDFDLLVCNPPFFVNSLKPEKESKKLARHTDSLPFEVLLACADRLASSQAQFIVLLPIAESEIFENELLKKNYSFHITEKLFIKDKENKKSHRVVLTLSRKNSVLLEKTLIIKDIENNYTPEFIALIQEYYLHL
ncbi:MAG: methyltransferase domain-containing protein [Cytophagales bacterium]|nr:MAG: methyltransferase domain-containing protein [Cytophagales bacterium]